MKTYIRHRIMNVIDVKNLVAVEYLDFEGKYKGYTEDHDFYELCYVERGEATVLLEDSEFTLDCGSIMLIAPNTNHTYRAVNGNHNRVFVICFECQSQSLKFITGSPVTVDADEISCIQNIIRECSGTFIMNEQDLLEVIPYPNFGGQQAVILNLEYLLINLLRHQLSEKKSGLVLLDGEKFYQDFVDIVISYLRNNLYKKITLNTICEHFNYSRSFICKIFKEQTGQTLISYLNNLKIEQSCKLLTDTNMTVTEVSEALGFTEAKYFCSVFKKKVGMSPQAYRIHTKNMA